MASAKQKRDALRRRRSERERRTEVKAQAVSAAVVTEPPKGAVLVDRGALAPANSYGAPEFVTRGYYVDTPFKCVDCGSDEVWTGAQQKFWFEVAKGFIYSIAKRCRACRRARKPKPSAP